MHENLKTQPDKVFMWFQKIYEYKTNTGKWRDLTEKDRQKKNFQWTIVKMFAVSKNPMTAEDYYKHLKECPELKEDVPGTNDKAVHRHPKWRKTYSDALVYTPHPITPYDLKMLLNTIGIRMIHFVEN